MTITDEQILNFITKVIAPSALGLGGHYLKRKLLDNVGDEANDVLDEIGVISSEMKSLTDETRFKRFLLFRSKNEKGGNKTTSVILEEVKPPFASVYHDYQKLKMDGYYADMVKDVVSSGKVVIQTAAMPKDALLRRIYEAENICSSKVFLLCNTKKYLYYASISTKDKGDLTSFERNKVELRMEKIRGIFEKYRAAIGD